MHIHLIFPRYICMFIFDDMGHIYCYRKKHSCCSTCSNLYGSPITKYSCCMQDAFIVTFYVVLPQRKSMKLHHLKETKGKLWKQFMIGLHGYLEEMRWSMTSTKAFSVAINGNHIVEEQHAYISSFSQIYMHVDLRLCGSHLWLSKKNTHATEKIPQMDLNHVRYQF